MPVRCGAVASNAAPQIAVEGNLLIVIQAYFGPIPCLAAIFTVVSCHNFVVNVA